MKAGDLDSTRRGGWCSMPAPGRSRHLSLSSPMPKNPGVDRLGLLADCSAGPPGRSRGRRARPRSLSLPSIWDGPQSTKTTTSSTNKANPRRRRTRRRPRRPTRRLLLPPPRAQRRFRRSFVVHALSLSWTSKVLGMIWSLVSNDMGAFSYARRKMPTTSSCARSRVRRETPPFWL